MSKKLAEPPKLSDSDDLTGSRINTETEQADTFEIGNSETEIVNIGKGKKDYSFYIQIGDRQYKRLWNSGQVNV